MKEFIRKNRLTLIGLVLGLSLGFIRYWSKPPVYKYRIVYEYDLSQRGLLSPVLLTDTFFIFDSYRIRNYKTSYSDTMRAQGIARSEFVIYDERILSKELILKGIRQNSTIPKSFSIHTFCQEGRYKFSKGLLLYPLLGIFVGLIISLLSATKLIPRKKEKTTPN